MHIVNPEAVGNPGQSPIIAPDSPEEADALRAMVENNRRSLGMPPQMLAEGLTHGVLAYLDDLPAFGVEIDGLGEEGREELGGGIQNAIEEAWQVIVPKGAHLVKADGVVERLAAAVSDLMQRNPDHAIAHAAHGEDDAPYLAEIQAAIEAALAPPSQQDTTPGGEA